MQLSIGIWLLLIAGLLLVLLEAANIIANHLHDDIRQSIQSFEAAIGVFSICNVLLLFGGIMLTRPERHAAHLHDKWELRWAIRLIPFIMALGFVLTWKELINSAVGSRQDADMSPLLIVFAASAFFVCMGFHLRSLAKRVLDSQLAEHCIIVGIGGAIALSACGIFNWLERSVGYYDPIGAKVRYIGWFFASLVFVLLFLLWAFFLMIRFAIQFRRASFAASRAWDEADLAREQTK